MQGLAIIILLFFGWTICALSLEMPGSFSLFIIGLGPVIGLLLGFKLIGCIIMLIISIIITNIIHKKYKKDHIHIESKSLKAFLLLFACNIMIIPAMFQKYFFNFMTIIKHPDLLRDSQSLPMEIVIFLIVEICLFAGIRMVVNNQELINLFSNVKLNR